MAWITLLGVSASQDETRTLLASVGLCLVGLIVQPKLLQFVIRSGWLKRRKRSPSTRVVHLIKARKQVMVAEL